jgi:hypothetical protein
MCHKKIIAKLVGVQGESLYHVFFKCTRAVYFWSAVREATRLKLPLLHPVSWERDLTGEHCTTEEAASFICGAWSLFLDNRYSIRPLRQLKYSLLQSLVSKSTLSQNINTRIKASDINASILRWPVLKTSSLALCSTKRVSSCCAIQREYVLVVLITVQLRPET